MSIITKAKKLVDASFTRKYSRRNFYTLSELNNVQHEAPEPYSYETLYSIAPYEEFVGAPEINEWITAFSEYHQPVYPPDEWLKKSEPQTDVRLNRPHQARNYSQEQYQEYLRCRNDIVYFANHYTVQETPDGLAILKLYDYQEQILRHFDSDDETVLNCARQLGKTSMAVVYIAWKTIFWNNTRCLLMAQTSGQSEEILSRLFTLYAYLPEFLQPGLITNSSSEITTDTGAVITAASSSPDAVRGRSRDIIYIDETAFVQCWDKLNAAIRPMLSRYGVVRRNKLIMTSTPVGNNHWKELCDKAKKENRYFELDWRAIKSRMFCRKTGLWDDGASWEANERDYLKKRFRQEHLVEFIGSDDTLISPEAIQRCYQQIQQPEAFGQGGVEDVFIWKRAYDSDKFHVVSVDIAEGVGGDYTVAAVYGFAPGQGISLEAAFRSNTKAPRDVVQIIANLAAEYDAVVSLEMSNTRSTAGNMLHALLEMDVQVFSDGNGRYGTEMTKQNKDLGVKLLKEIVENGSVDIPWDVFCQELDSFITKDNGKTYAAYGEAHDDTVMTLLNLLLLIEQHYNRLLRYFEEYDEIEELNSLEQEYYNRYLTMFAPKDNDAPTAFKLF